MTKILRLISATFFLFLLISTAQGATITIAPTDTQMLSNCFPFGNGNAWTPYMGFIYQNVPAFSLKPGNIIAFDLGHQNDKDIQLDIALAATTVNGGTVQSGSFTTVVTNTQTPQNPRGDEIIGNYELRFTIEQPFDFPGGGLIIRFSNPSASYASDNTCDQVLVGATNADSSGYFIEGFVHDSDGVSPWQDIRSDALAAFRIITQGDNGATPIPALTQWGMIIFIVLAGFGAVYFMRRKLRINN